LRWWWATRSWWATKPPSRPHLNIFMATPMKGRMARSTECNQINVPFIALILIGGVMHLNLVRRVAQPTLIMITALYQLTPHPPLRRSQIFIVITTHPNLPALLAHGTPPPVS
jgi:hypothetical protein